MRVLVIPEDFRKDQYMLKPIISAMVQTKNAKAKVRVCQDPLLGGVSQALRWERIAEILERYPMVDLFLLCVDRDGKDSRRASLDSLEEKARMMLAANKQFLAENAWQELEVWVLAGHKDLPTGWSWQEIRAEIDPKESYFIPFAEQKGLLDSPGEGRKILGEEAARSYNRIRDLCPEVAQLEERIRIQ